MGIDSLWITDCVGQWEKPLIAYARRLLGSDDAARDVVQETFLRLCRQPRDGIEHRLVEWLFTVVRHCAIDHLRKEQTMQHQAEPLTADVTANFIKSPAGNAENRAFSRYADKVLDPAFEFQFQFPRGESLKRVDPAELFRVQKTENHWSDLKRSKLFVADKFFPPF